MEKIVVSRGWRWKRIGSGIGMKRRGGAVLRRGLGHEWRWTGTDWTQQQVLVSSIQYVVLLLSCMVVKGGGRVGWSSSELSNRTSLPLALLDDVLIHKRHFHLRNPNTLISNPKTLSSSLFLQSNLLSGPNHSKYCC